jgi:hypothetical protein
MREPDNFMMTDGVSSVVEISAMTRDRACFFDNRIRQTAYLLCGRWLSTCIHIKLCRPGSHASSTTSEQPIRLFQEAVRIPDPSSAIR